MSPRKILKSALWNFLGAYTSRYTDFEGYWLFGFLVPEPKSLEVDLLASHPVATTPVESAAHWAELKFADQLKKAGIERSRLRSAKLRITRNPDMIRCPIYRVLITLPAHFLPRDGYMVSFHAEAELDTGHRFTVEREVFVAPHDPALEMRCPPQ